MPPISSKHPSATITLVFDWRRWLKPGVSITTHSVTVSGVTLGTSSLSGGVVTASISGGTAGTTATVTCSVTTNATPAVVQVRTWNLAITTEV